MQKFLRTLTLLACLAMPWVAQAQNTLTVADGTSTNGNVPVHGTWADAYLRCQTIYPAAMLEESAEAFGMTGGTITSLTYYQSSAAAEAYTGTWEVKLTEVSAVSLSGWQDVSSATTVYTGTLDATVSPLVINFTTPYTYNGGNLLVEVSQVQTGNWKSVTFLGVSSTGASWQGYNSSAWASITGSAQNFIPKTTFTFSGGTPITCRVVSSVECTDLSATTATLTWTDANNTGASYSVYNGDQFVASVAAGTYTYTFTGLDPNTDYTLAVAANCSATDASAAKGVSVRTPCSSVQMPFAEAFDANLSSDACWAHASGVTAAEVFNGASLTLDAGGGAWAYQTAVSNGLPAGHYRVNIYGSSCKNWLITPNIDLTSAASAQLTFDAAFTAYSGTAPAANFESNSTQTFMVLISTDNGQTWLESNATKWQNEGGNYTLASLSGIEYLEQTVNLNAYIGQTIRIAFYAQSTTSGGDNNIHIDNINIDVVPTCFKVTDLTVSAVTNNSVTLAWTDAINSGATYSIYNGDEILASGIAGTTYTVTGLDANSPYTLSVVANCAADDASRPANVSFRTECDPFITLPYSNDLESEPFYSYNVTPYANAFPNCWTRLNDATGSTNYYPYVGSSSSYAHSGMNYFYFYASTSSTVANNQLAVLPAIDPTVYPMNGNMVSFWARCSSNSARTIEVGTMSDKNDASTFTTVETITVPNATYAFYRVKLTSSPATNPYVAIRLVKGTTASTIYVDDIAFEQIPSCWKVENLAVTAVSNNSVALSWSPNAENTGDVTYIVMNGSEVVASGIADTAYTVTGLTASTEYTFSVLTSCGADDNAEPVEVSTRTMCDPQALPILTTFEDDDATIDCYSVSGSWSKGAGDPSGSAAAHDGLYNVCSNHTNNGDIHVLMTPMIDLSTVESAMLKFWHTQRNWSGDQDELRVYYRTSLTADWTLLPGAEWTSDISEWTEERFILPNLSANYQLAFVVTDGYGYGVAIDDIEIDETPRHTVSFAYLTTDAGVAMGSTVADNANPYWNSTVTLTSTPATNMRTAAWYAGEQTSVDGLTPLAVDTNVLEVLVTSDTTITVVYGYGQFEIKGITANANQARMGSVAGDSPYNNDMYDYATTATLTATANTGFQFIEWLDENGDQYSTENPIAIEALQPLTLTAHFGIASYEVTAEAEHGHVEGVGPYTFGASATLTAVADEHYHFVRWADDDMTNATRAYRVVEAKTFHPVFEPDVYTVTVSGPAVATYTVKDAEGNETNQFAYTTEATVEATAIDEHYTFVSWNDAEGNEVGTTNPYTFAVESDITLTPVYSADQMTLTIASNDADMGSVSFEEFEGTSVTVDYLTQVMVKAEAVVGDYSSFAGWYNGEELVSSTADYLVTVDQPMTLTAHFEFAQYPVTVAADPAVAGTATASSLNPQFSDNVTFTATAAPHWVFSHWTYAGQDAWLSQNTEYSEMVFEALNLVAHFVRDNHTIAATVADATHGTTTVTDENGAVATDPFTHGTYATVSFVADYGYEFAGWEDQNGDLISTENPFTFEVTEDTVLTATVSPLPYTVYVDVNADDEGYIRGAAYVSESDVSFTYDYLTEINAQLTTDPVYGYVFDNWTNVNNEVVELPMVLTQDTNVFANFKKDQFEVKGSVAADYRMMGRVAGTETVDYLEYVTLTANENTGYNFVKWVDADGNDIDLAATYDEPTTGLVYDIYTNINGASIDVLANEAHELFAVYDYETYTVSVAANDAAMGSVTINGEAVSEKVLAYSQTVTLQALPVKHYHFVDWNDGNTENPRTFILNEENAVLYTANFAIDTHTVTFTYNADQVDSISLVPTNSAISVSATNTYDYNTELQAYIEPAHGYDFMGWSHDGETDAESANTYTFTLEQDTNLMPLFENHQFTVTVASADDAMGTVEGNATVAYQGTTTIKATANYGYDFVNWTNNLNGDVLTDAEATVQVLDDITYTAHFTEHLYEVVALANTDEMGTVEFQAGVAPLQDDAVLGEASGSNNYIPTYSLYENSLSQQIYTAEEIGGAATFNSLTMWLRNSSSYSRNIEIYMKEIQESTFAANNSWVSLSDGDLVATATIENGVTSYTATTFTFTTPFNYSGNGNLLVCINDNTGNWSSGVSSNTYAATAQAIYAYRDGTAYDVTNPAVNGTVLNVKSVITLGVVPPSGAGSEDVVVDINGVAHVKYNKNVSMVATENEHYDFVDWTNAAGDHFTDNPLTVTVVRDSTLTANFVKEQYTITAATQFNNGATGSVAITGTTEDNITVEYLDEVTLTATVDEPYRLLRWENQYGESLGNANPLTISATTDSTITAVFDYEVYSLTANTEDIEMGGVYVNDPNAVPEPLTVADGSTTNGYVPVYGFYADAYLRSHMVYPAADLANMAGADINKMTFYATENSVDWGTNFNVYISEVADATISAFADVNDMDLVYAGPLSIVGGQMVVNFTNDYSYNGGNLLVAIEQIDNGSYSSSTWLGAASTGSCVQGYSYNSLDEIAAGQKNFLPKTTFDYVFAGVTPSLPNSSADVDYGTSVEVVATPGDHYHFVGWKGANGDTITALGTVVNPPITVVCDSTLTALFDGDQMPMTYQVNNAIRGSVEGPATAEYNTEVVIEAVASTGYAFTQWEDGNAENPRTVTVAGTDAENTYKAIFDYKVYNVAVNVTNGTVSVTNDVRDINDMLFTDVESINSKYYYGSEIELTYNANEHYHFVVNNANVTSFSETLSLLTNDDPEAITKEAVIDQHNVTLVANDPALGTIEGATSGVYDYGTELTFTATPAEHQHFVNWSDDVEDAERTITVEGDITLTANFQVNEYAVAAEADAEQGVAIVTVSDAEVSTVLPNTNVTFTATANPGYEFVNWTNNGEEVSTEASFSMPIVENTTLTANFNFVGFAITVASNNDVMGAAYINDDAEQTTYVAAYEEEVTLNAVPEYGYIFENWTLNGTEVSTEATATVQATAAANYIANFNFDNFDLNVSVAEGQDERGTVTGAGNYPYGTQVEIAAVANDGFLFTTWNDGVTTATRTVTVDGVTEYVASFRTDAIYTVTVIAENGTVSGAGTGFVENDLVSLNAVPATGYRFVNYTDAEGTVLSDNAAYSFNITSDVTLTANFAALPYDVVLNVNDAAMGTVAGAGEYTFGTQVEISATANEGYRFVQWSDDVTTNPRTIVVTADVELTAQFEAIPATVYYIAATAVNGTVEGAGEYEEGDQVTLTATANNCYQFAGWMNGTELVSTANPYVFNATQNLTLMATFEAQSFSGEETQVACESYTWNGQTYTASGDYTATLVSDKGCDSVATLHLTINTPVNVEQTAQACTEYTWTVNNQTYTESGVYTASITDANGCNATATLTLTINDVLTETVVASSCGSYEWNGQTYDASGSYTYTTTGVNGCDSIVTLQLTVNEAVSGGDSTAVACGSFEWNNEFYTQSGDYTINLIAANGCDSTVTLHLTINQAVDVAVYDTACDTYTWSANNVDYNSTGTYLYTFEQGTVTGCDSTVTLYLVINSSVNTTIEATATGSYEWNDTTYTESGEYTFNGQTVNGCDSIVTLLLTIETQTYTVTVNVNNSAMGTVNPAGEITVAAGETFTATAEANEGFRFIGWSNGATTETVTITVESDTTLTANFEAITYTINATANDETMGYVTGSGEYSHGAVVTLEAVANNGYHFVRWSDGTTNAHYEFNAIADVTITAYFEADQTQGIEDVDGADVNIYSADSKIIVKGAENLDIYVYDVNGRVVRTQAAAAETVEFTMNTTGVYLVKVGNAPAKRVVVVR